MSMRKYGTRYKGISPHSVYALVPIETEFIDVIMALETIRAEHPKVENEQACKRLAGRLAQRIY